MRSRTLFFLLIILGFQSRASDSLPVLRQQDFLSVLLEYHPVISQTNLRVAQADAAILQARGAVDPKLQGGVARKTFNGSLYYNYFTPELSVPTWYGIQFKAGLEEATGTYLNSESTPGKTSYAGVYLSVHELVFNTRRAILQQASAYRDMSEAERRLAINDLMYDAFNAYWDWMLEYKLYALFSEAVRISKTRINFVRVEFEQGARPAIDTVEVLTQYQNLLIQLNESRNNLQNAGIRLSGFLWGENSQPFNWSNQLIPDTSSDLNPQPPPLDALLQVGANHPELDALGLEINVLEIERRLKAQSFIPKIDVGANMLQRGYGIPIHDSYNTLAANNKYSVGVSVPLFMREARGAYKQARLKIQENESKRALKFQLIANKIKSEYNDLLNQRQQTSLYEELYRNATRLYQGERLRFETGESTLFLLNTRENSMLDNARKLEQARVKWQKAYTAVWWAAGAITALAIPD